MNAQVLQTAAAILCLVGETEIPLQKSLACLGSPPTIHQLHHSLLGGDQQSRARAMAEILQRLGADLDAWSVA